MGRGSARAPSQRQLRVGEELRHVLSRVFERGDLYDPALRGVPLTVSEVRLGPDLRNATVFVMRLGGGDMESVLAALKRLRPQLRHELARAVRLKYVPNLVFAEDTTFANADSMNALLHRPDVVRDLQQDGGGAGSDDGGGSQGADPELRSGSESDGA